MLAFAGGKGGTGKTTTALAFARVLSAARTHDERGRPVTVVDADVDMPDVHAMVGVDRTPTVLECPCGRPVPSLSGVRVAPAPPADATDAFERTLSELRAPEGRSGGGDRNAARGRTRRCVVVDAPCGGGPDAARPLAAADGVVLVTRPTPAAVRDTAKTAAMARALETPVAAAVVVGDRPPRALEDVLGTPRVVTVPVVDDDPLTAPAHRAAMGRLWAALRRGRHLFTE